MRLARECFRVMQEDADRLQLVDDYLHGIQADPYIPDGAGDEYKLLAKRSITNITRLLADTPAQAMYVDRFVPGRESDIEARGEESPEWDHWQRSRLDARQGPIYRGAFNYGHSWVVTEHLKYGGEVISYGVSAMNSAGIFRDPANDEAPVIFLTVTDWPDDLLNDGVGTAHMWDETNKYEVTFARGFDVDKISAVDLGPHGNSSTPVTRFVCALDLEGRTLGVIEPMIPVQDRINQSVFDLLVAQTYVSTEARWVTGMAPPIEYETTTDEEGRQHLKFDNQGRPVPKVDQNGNVIPRKINMNASRMMYAEDPNTTFGSFKASSLDGFISSIDMSIRHFSAISQTPPHHLLGQIANLSAEALDAAEIALRRKVHEFQNSFGESWERVFRLAAELENNVEAATDYHGEVQWRDLEDRGLAAAADGLGKLSEGLHIPAKGLWGRIPGVTKNELDNWETLWQDQDREVKMLEAMNRVTSQQSRPAPRPGFTGAVDEVA